MFEAEVEVEGRSDFLPSANDSPKAAGSLAGLLGCTLRMKSMRTESKPIKISSTSRSLLDWII